MELIRKYLTLKIQLLCVVLLGYLVVVLIYQIMQVRCNSQQVVLVFLLKLNNQFILYGTPFIQYFGQ